MTVMWHKGTDSVLAKRWMMFQVSFMKKYRTMNFVSSLKAVEIKLDYYDPCNKLMGSMGLKCLRHLY